MNTNQVEWASKHDWFISARYMRHCSLYIVTVRDYIADDILGQWVESTVKFSDIKQLKQWAGY